MERQSGDGKGTFLWIAGSLLAWKILPQSFRDGIIDALLAPPEPPTPPPSFELRGQRVPPPRWTDSTLPTPFPAPHDRPRKVNDSFAELLESLSFNRSLKDRTAPALQVSPPADARWRSVLIHPAIVLVIGKRGSGKSALAYRLLELFRYQAAPYVVGAPSKARTVLPDWIGIAQTLEDLPPKTIAVIDEAYLRFHARAGMTSQSRAMSGVVNLSRQREQTLIFVTQEARQADRNISSSASAILFKEPNALQAQFERRELRGLVEQAQAQFGVVKGDKRRWTYAHAPDSDFVGMLEIELPTFWKPSLSKLFAAGAVTASPRSAKRPSSGERSAQAKRLRRQGWSLREIARELGVSKATVVNYLKNYPYQR